METTNKIPKRKLNGTWDKHLRPFIKRLQNKRLRQWLKRYNQEK